MVNKLKYVQSWTDHLGRKRYRFRRKNHRLFELPHPESPNFLATYNAAFEGRRLDAEPFARIANATWIYLFRHSDEAIKIGVSQNVHRRRTQVAGHFPEKLQILHASQVGSGQARCIEAAAMFLLRPLRIKGEWFRASDDIALLALYVAETGDIETSNLLRQKIDIESRDAKDVRFDADWRKLLRRLHAEHPKKFKNLNPFCMAETSWSKPRSKDRPAEFKLPSDYVRPYGRLTTAKISIYPEEWNAARKKKTQQSSDNVSTT
jgi:hypothetical protein